MDIFEYAIQMERDGEQYYRKLAEQTPNKGLKTILTMLADEEVKHCNVIEQMRTDSPHLAETTILQDARNVFAQIRQADEQLDPHSEQIDLYRKAQDIEQNSRDFYLEKADEVKEEYQKDIFLQLAEQENKHYFLLDNIIEFVSRPKTWLENAEFVHLQDY
ncbi:MAG: ferritin family protein [Planctomycetota bacterium]|jgi:rubrerythrin